MADIVKETDAKAFAISGGVAANSLLRKEAESLSRKLGIPLFIPPKKYCTDNGAMIASAGFFMIQAGHTSGLDLDAESGLELFSW